MMLALLLLAQAATAEPASIRPGPETEATAKRYDQCVNLATGDPDKGVADAGAWRTAGGGYFARQCLGIAYANQARWAAAAEEFASAAREAEIAHDVRAAQYWAQSGNAWLATGDMVKAQRALDAALAAGTLTGLQRGEALFDRARSLVVTGDLASARIDMDGAVDLAADDPLVWLSSATLARRMNDLPRARRDIAEAYRRAPDDASIHLEIGNIAAVGGDENGARSAWADVIRLAPNSPMAESARKALTQFDAPKSP